MTIYYALLVYLLPMLAACFGLLLIREYGYVVLLRMAGWWLLREAERAERRQLQNAHGIRRRLEEVA